MTSPLLDKIIGDIDTAKSRTEGTSGFKHYSVTQDMIDRYGRSEIISVLTSLEEQLPAGQISVSWIKKNGVKADVKKFSVRKEAIEDLYSIAGRTSSRRILQMKQQKLQQIMDRAWPEWLRNDYFGEMQKTIDNGRVPKRLKDKQTYDALWYVISNDKPDYMRTFSQHHFGMSKIFETQYKSAVCSILRSHCPDFTGLEITKMSDNDILRHFNILTYNNYFEFKGPCVYNVNDRPFSAEGLIFGHIMNTDTILSADIVDCPHVKRVITIENKANFYSRNYKDDTLYLFVHGFPAPCELRLYRQIAEHLPDAEFMHWGDLDCGGIRIFQYLKKNVFPGLRPLHMDEEAYRRYQTISSGYELTKNTVSILKNMDAGELTPLKNMLVKYGRGFEQEAMLVNIAE